MKRVASRKYVCVSISLILLVGLQIFAQISGTPAQVSGSRRRMRDDLRELGAKPSAELLSCLFSHGDMEIEAIVEGLSDSDPDVQVGSQMIIRYLGNPTGLSQLLNFYAKAKQNTVVVIEPVAAPLAEWDFQYLAGALVKGRHFGSERLGYSVALEVDGSERAQKLLQRINEFGSTSSQPFLSECGKSNLSRSFEVGGSLEKSVLDQACFLKLTDRDHASTKLLAYNSLRDKALVEIRDGQRSIHIVVSRRGDTWTFFSVTLFRIS